ncbi:uncharacterized protein LOC117823314 [Notolabrus celidotus]|uniref:uncharacterized protein LOC117823314 n=1 Tax=Notolabrus celidotus TaxID=1203425 RepID=UPI0014904895|nr:uncharacterized protein LOC117823314 [Notolabrus celidotus]
MELLRNGSLVIGCLTEEDQGLYWCKVCFQDDCLVEQPTVISIKKEIHKETHKMLFIPAGVSFTHACPSELPNLKWTFKASDTTADRDPLQEGPLYSVTSNKSLKILNVKTQNAGQYTCSIRGCNGRWKQLLILNLCVITVHHNEDSSDSCAVVCDIESSYIEPNSTSNVHTGTRILSVSRAPNGSLNCRTTPIFVRDSEVNGTSRSAKDVDNTTGTESELIPVVYAASALLVCLILMALLIWYLTPRLQRVYPIQPYCCGLNHRVEEENPVVYSSIIIRRYADTGITMAQDNPVYSEIRR